VAVGARAVVLVVPAATSFLSCLSCFPSGGVFVMGSPRAA